MLSAGNFVFVDFFAIKVDRSNVNQGICKESHVIGDLMK